jgi:hypothetical protein
MAKRRAGEGEPLDPAVPAQVHLGRYDGDDNVVRVAQWGSAPGVRVGERFLSNATVHGKVRALADEQAALRRVATLVAKQTPQKEVFARIVEEIGRLLAVDSIEMATTRC